MREPAIGSYRDADGARHELVVRATNEGDWEVLDVVGAETRKSSTGWREIRTAVRRPRRSPATTSAPPAVSDARRDRRPASPYLSREDPMPAATAAPSNDRAQSAGEELRCRVRLADGRVFTGPLAPERHRALQLGILHQHTAGLVELAAGARRDGRLHITTRRRADHFLPGGQAGRAGWLQALLALAARHADRGEEVFVAPAARRGRARGQARGRRDPLPVGRRRPPRPATGPMGAPGGTPVPPARLDRGQRRRPRLLEARPATARDPHDRDDRRARRADRTRAPADRPPARSQR